MPSQNLWRWLGLAVVVGGVGFLVGTGARVLPRLLASEADLVANIDLPPLVRGPSKTLAVGPVERSIGDSLPGLGDAYGLIADVAIGPDGLLAILDARLNRIRVYSPTGRPLATIGRPGRGPGEFAVPRAVAMARHRRAFILDSGNRRISEYLLAGDAVRHVADHRLPFDPRDMCALGDMLVVLGSHNGAILHSYGSPLREPVADFGAPFAADQPQLEATLADGLVACDPKTGAVFAVSHMLPDVRAYDGQGELRWRTSLPHFRRMVAQKVDGGGLQFRHPPEGRSDYVTSIGVTGSLVVVQFGPKERGQSFGLDSARTVLLDLSTGQLLGEQMNLPVLQAIEDRAFRPQWDPYPRLHVHRIRIRDDNAAND